MSGLFDYVTAHPGLLLFTVVSVAIVAYLLYAMINPTRF
ncbi:MAG: potassium-transporting ATPase subunit F [Thermoplasmata archaeon]|nr:potassium-transporting ATPase subunit F [Thermoplasmata archaeon]